MCLNFEETIISANLEHKQIREDVLWSDGQTLYSKFSTAQGCRLLQWVNQKNLVKVQFRGIQGWFYGKITVVCLMCKIRCGRSIKRVKGNCISKKLPPMYPGNIFSGREIAGMNRLLLLIYYHTLLGFTWNGK